MHGWFWTKYGVTYSCYEYFQYSKIFCLIKLSNKGNEMLSSCSFVFNADIDKKHLWFLINIDLPNFCNKEAETGSLTISVFLLLIWARYCLSSYRFFYVRFLVFYWSIILYFRFYVSNTVNDEITVWGAYQVFSPLPRGT